MADLVHRSFRASMGMDALPASHYRDLALPRPDRDARQAGCLPAARGSDSFGAVLPPQHPRPLAATYPTAGVLFATGPDRLGGGRAGGRQALQWGRNGCNPLP